LALIVGTALGPHESTSQVHNDMMDFGDAGVSPTAFSHSVHNVAAAYIAQALNIHGPCLTVTDFEDVATRCRQLAECWLAEGTCDAVLVVIIDEAGFVFDKIEAEFGAPFAGIRESAQAFLLTKGST
jgi:3-oxoacyl-[acyl-carrier-protein] synthase II